MREQENSLNMTPTGGNTREVMLGEVGKPIGIASSQVVSDCAGSWSHEGDSTLAPSEISHSNHAGNDCVPILT